MPRDVWLRLLGSAQHEIGILDYAGLSPVRDQLIVAALTERAGSGVNVRMCLYDSDAPGLPQRAVRPETSNALATNMGDILAVYAPLMRQGWGSHPATSGHPIHLYLLRRRATPGQPARLRHPRRTEAGPSPPTRRRATKWSLPTSMPSSMAGPTPDRRTDILGTKSRGLFLRPSNRTYAHHRK